MTVIEFVAQRNIHLHTQGLDKVAVLIAVEHKRMHHLHLTAALIEIEADHEGERTHPTPPCEGGRWSKQWYMHALNFYHRTHSAFPFHDGRTNLALVVGKINLPGSFPIGLALRGANQTQALCHFPVLQQEGIHQEGSLLRNKCHKRIGRHPQPCCCFGDLKSSLTGSFLFTFLNRKEQLSPSGELVGGRRRSQPFHRPVGPVSQRPCIGRHRIP